MTKKNTTKVKPAFTVNITDCNTVKDVKLAFALAKFNSSVALSTDDLEAIINEVIEAIPTAVVVDCTMIEKCEDRKPWYKRFWNWLTRKN